VNPRSGLKIWWLPLAVLLLGGCTLPINIDSRPQGAQVFFDGQEMGVTPYRASLGPTSPWISVRAPGYAIESVEWGVGRSGGGMMGMSADMASTFRFNLKRSGNVMQGQSLTGPASPMPSAVPSGGF